MAVNYEGKSFMEQAPGNNIIKQIVHILNLIEAALSYLYKLNT